MSKYSPSDDGKVIDGRIVVFVRPRAGEPSALSDAQAAQNEQQLASATAASMTAAAEDGVPLCEDCAQAHAELEQQLEEAE